MYVIFTWFLIYYQTEIDNIVSLLSLIQLTDIACTLLGMDNDLLRETARLFCPVVLTFFNKHRIVTSLIRNDWYQVFLPLPNVLPVLSKDCWTSMWISVFHFLELAKRFSQFELHRVQNGGSKSTTLKKMGQTL